MLQRKNFQEFAAIAMKERIPSVAAIVSMLFLGRTPRSWGSGLMVKQSEEPAGFAAHGVVAWLKNSKGGPKRQPTAVTRF